MFSLDELLTLRKDVSQKPAAERKLWLIQQIRQLDTSGTASKQKHLPYTVKGRAVCRAGFMAAYDINTTALHTARSVVQNAGGALTVHGNTMPQVAGNRGQMRYAAYLPNVRWLPCASWGTYFLFVVQFRDNGLRHGPFNYPARQGGDTKWRRVHQHTQACVRQCAPWYALVEAGNTS